MHKNTQIPTRHGAALIIAIVLLACLAIVTGMVLPQILRDRQESRLDLVRIQARQLLDDAFRNAETAREADPEFLGAALTLGPDIQPFPGTFLVTTQFANDVLTAEVQYRNVKGELLYRQTKGNAW